MFYSYELIADMGFDNTDAFIEDYIQNHPNCCIRCVPGGLICDYDFDSEPSLAWSGYVPEENAEQIE